MPEGWKTRGKGKKQLHRCLHCGLVFISRRMAWMCSDKCRKAEQRIRDAVKKTLNQDGVQVGRKGDRAS